MEDRGYPTVQNPQSTKPLPKIHNQTLLNQIFRLFSLENIVFLTLFFGITLNMLYQYGNIICKCAPSSLISCSTNSQITKTYPNKTPIKQFRNLKFNTITNGFHHQFYYLEFYPPLLAYQLWDHFRVACPFLHFNQCQQWGGCPLT